MGKGKPHRPAEFGRAIEGFIEDELWAALQFELEIVGSVAPNRLADTLGEKRSIER